MGRSALKEILTYRYITNNIKQDKQKLKNNNNRK